MFAPRRAASVAGHQSSDCGSRVESMSAVDGADEAHSAPASASAAADGAHPAPASASAAAASGESHPVLSDVEHILHRPDTFIGSVGIDSNCNVIEFIPREKSDASDEDNGGITTRVYQADVSHALIQLVLEIITNANDHAKRSDSGVRNIWIAFDDGTGTISVRNDGVGILPRPHKMLPDKLLPEVIFSVFRCGSNFDDTESRQGAGRNGYGCKAVNAFSTEFTVTTHAGFLKYEQTWSQNMSHCTTPRVTTCKAENGGTTVQFVPDYARLGVRDIPGAMRYLRSLAWFLSAVTPRKVAVWLDGAKLPISNLKQFAAALSPTGKCVYDDDSAPAFEVAVIPRVEHPATCMAFVNGIPCHWGTHVTHVVNLFCARLTEILKCKERNVTEALLGRHLTVLINAQVVNPVFKTQTKERLSKNPLGIEWKPQDKFWNALRRSTMLASLADELSGLEQSKVQAQAVKGNSASTRHVNVEKLEDAHEAGNPARAQNTVLILTEGDSAKAMAVNGLSVVGRQYYGVFPLRGKMINACGNRAAALKNEEVIKLLRILGVTLTGQQRRLRYDEIMILTDQDSDGHHCAGLILSFLNEFLPEMLRQNPRFVSRFGTALIKVTGPGNTLVASFTNEAAFNRWWEVQLTSTQMRYHVKYYKGLATSTVMESKEYFVNIDKHQLFIDCTDPADIALLNQFFSGKDDTDARKQMITELDPLDYEVDYTSGSIRLRQFLLGELLSFSCDNNARSLPCAIDGLKTSQRKILYVLLQQKIFKPDMKVAQLQGLVAKNTLYAHAEDTLGTTARTMAGEHNHNINLLVPEGNFGNRHGDEPGATRYIFTCAEPIARALFSAEDDFVLDRLTCEGELVEPNYLVPVIALVLCNGASGLGTGFACSVPACDVEQVLRWTRAHVAARRAAAAATDSTGQGTEDEDTGAGATDAGATDGAAEATADLLAACPPPEIPCPHLNMFGGKSVEVTPGRTWAFKGIVTRPESHVFRVTDLPMETNNFHKAAVKALGPLLKYTTPNNTDVKVDMTYVLHSETDVATVDAMWQKLQKLATLNVSAGNMYLWDADTKLRKFRSFEDILRHHADVRFARYSRRKAHQIAQLQQKITELDDKCKFINAVIQDPAVLHNRRSDEVEAWLEAGGFARVNGTFAHLLSMHISSTTVEMLERLRANCGEATARLAVLQGQSELDLWDADLDVLDQAYQDFLATREARHRAPSAPSTAGKPSSGAKTQSRGVKRGATGQASAAKRKKVT